MGVITFSADMHLSVITLTYRIEPTPHIAFMHLLRCLGESYGWFMGNVVRPRVAIWGDLGHFTNIKVTFIF
jgi:hypothetical protein